MHKKTLLHFIRNPKRMRLLIISAFCAVFFGLLMFFVPPKNTIFIMTFFGLLFCTLFFLVSSIFHAKHGLIIGGGVTVYFILRFLEFRHPLYAILIVITIISLEVSMRKR